MKNFRSLSLLLSVLLSLIVASCGTTSTVPITGRSHSLLVDDQQVLSLSTQQYNQFMQSAKTSTNKANCDMVKRVGQRLATAVETYLRNNGYASELQNFAWEFNLVQNTQVNAFCMPGGKIVVYEGLLPVAQNETALAVVLGHEIAHAVAKHSAEQMSTKLRQQYGTQILTQIVSAKSQGLGQLAGLAAQSGFSFANLKYSRENETEADYMGLIFMAMAGYDPQQAIPFWQRMSAGKTAQSDILSDHPSDAKRIAALQKAMPEALKYYKPVTTTTTNSSSAKKGTSTKKNTSTKKTTTTKKTK